MNRKHKTKCRNCKYFVGGGKINSMEYIPRKDGKTIKELYFSKEV